jgi:3-hydroxyisobutyrate dehydrogenase-like beta-hydroxyacid dehydrogenase
MSRKIVDSPRIAVIGLGEAGRLIASGLAKAGADVVGFDPAVSRVARVRVAASAAAAARGAAAVLSVNSGAACVDVARGLGPALVAGQLYADLNTAAPAVKAAVAAAVAPAGARFADVALMAPVQRAGAATPSLASGDGAHAYAELVGRFGAPVEVVGLEPGVAAGRKLLRSIFMKGMAAAALESVAAARAAGCEPWLHDELAGVLEQADAALLDRLLEGSRVHAVRRTAEMCAACDMVRDLGVEPRVGLASVGWLLQLEAEAEGSRAA